MTLTDKMKAWEPAAVWSEAGEGMFTVPAEAFRGVAERLKAEGFVDAGIIGRRLVQNFLRQGKRVGSHGNFAEIKSRTGILQAFEAEIAHSGQRNADSCILQGLFAFFTDFLLKFNNFSFLFLAFLCFIIFDIQRNCPDFLLCAEL